MSDNHRSESTLAGGRKLRRLLEAADSLVPDGKESLRFQHSILCQTSLPYRDPGPDTREWKRSNGRAHLLITASKFLPDTTEWLQVGLPWGSKARLILIYLNAESMRTKSPVIQIGTRTTFSTNLLNRPATGRDVLAFDAQIKALLGAMFQIGFMEPDQSSVYFIHIVSHFFWTLRDHISVKKFIPTVESITLTNEYFESLARHAVPLNERAINALSESCMALDAYCWLAQRLHRVPSGKHQLVPWVSLKEQFGWHHNRMDIFKRAFRKALLEVRTQYSEAKFEVNERGLLIEQSPPPVRRKMILTPKS